MKALVVVIESEQVSSSLSPMIKLKSS